MTVQQQLVRNAQLQYAALGGSAGASQTVRQTMAILPPRLQLLYAQMRAQPGAPLASVNPELLRTTATGADIVELETATRISEVVIPVKRPQRTEEQAAEPKKAEEVTQEQLLRMDPVIFSDFALLEGIPLPPRAETSMSPEQRALVERQRKAFAEEMARYSRELVQAMEE